MTTATAALTLSLYPFPKSPFPRPNPSPTTPLRSPLPVKCQSLSDPPESVYRGAYGPWRIESSDVQEVILYRSGLVTAASSFVIASSTAFTDSELFDFVRSNLDLFYGLGACGLGLSLYLIHIYVSEIKRALQALWAVGAVGSLGAYATLARPAGSGLVEYVVANPAAVWFVGPLFAALTGLVFKEGLCYGKLEAGVLTFIIPTLLLGHLVWLIIALLSITIPFKFLTFCCISNKNAENELVSD